MTDPISAIIAATQFIFTSSSFVAQTIRFIGSTLITAALSGSKVPRLSDLKVQTSSFGAPIPRLYGESVRVAGNIIDKSDLIPRKHKKGGIDTVVLGKIGGVKYYTYDAHFGVLLCEGALPANSLKRIFADGKVIFDRDAPNSTAGAAIPGVADSLTWNLATKTHQCAISITFYRGTATQGVDPDLSALHSDDLNYPAYRHSAYVVFNNFKTSDFGNRVPNLEFEVETDKTTVRQVVEELGSFADVDIYAGQLRDDIVHGYIVAVDGSVWNAIEPLAAAYAFDLYLNGARFDARKRGRYVTTTIPEGKWAAQEVSDEPGNRKDVAIENADKFPDAVTVTYLDRERDYQPNTQQASLTQGYSRSKVNTEVPLVLTADEARNLAQRTLYEAFAAAHTIKIQLSEEYRWLKGGDIPALAVGGNQEPFRIRTVTRSPNGVIELEESYEDPLLYTNNLTGALGDFPTNDLALAGDTILQPVDGPIVANADDDTGFYAFFVGTGPAWRGAEVYRALGIGSPLSFALIGNIGLAAPIGDCDSTLPDGPTDVWDYGSSLTVTMIGGDAPETATEEDVLTNNVNLAWVGDPDTGAGEYINFATVTPTSPDGTYVLTDFLRGRYGTEFATALHGSGERFVIMSDADVRYRIDTGAVGWNMPRTYRSISLFLEDGLDVEFTNTGEGKRPLSGVHLNGTRDGSNNLTIDWERRTRYQTGDIAAAVPLGEELEAYEVDITVGSPSTVIRTIAATTPQVSYSASDQTADGFTPGDPIDVEVYQMSSIRGRGRVLRGTV